MDIFSLHFAVYALCSYLNFPYTCEALLLFIYLFIYLFILSVAPNFIFSPMTRSTFFISLFKPCHVLYPHEVLASRYPWVPLQWQMRQF
jgi:hypothetical protein